MRLACGRPRRGEIEPRALGEQLELAQQGLRSDPGCDGVCLPERYARLGAGRAGGDERLGLAPAAVGREGGRSRCSHVAAASDHDSGRATPRARSCSASARASQPAAFGVIGDGLGGGAASDRRSASRARSSQPRRASASRRARASAASSACARRPFAQSWTRIWAPRAGAREPALRRWPPSASVQRRSHSARSAR